jgi:hypothetical protein
MPDIGLGGCGAGAIIMISYTAAKARSRRAWAESLVFSAKDRS